MMKRIKLNHVLQCIFFLLVIVCFESSASEQPSNYLTSSNTSLHLKHWLISKDQTPKSTFHNPPDSLWLPLSSTVENGRYNEGNWLLRTDIVIDDSVSSKVILGLFPIYFVTAYEIYWDGMKIAQNGIIGIDETDEKAGLFNFNVLLSSHLIAIGKHTITLRISNHHNYSSWKWFYGDFLIAPYDIELKNIFLSRYPAFFIIGILFIPFLFNLFLYFARKSRTEHLLFSLICFIVILDSVTSLIPIFIDAPTTFAHWELYAYQVITLLFTILFPAFFIYSFSFPKNIIGITIIINFTIFFFLTSIGNVFTIMSLTVLIISSIITLWALHKRREGSIVIFIGLIAAWIAYFFNFAFAGLAATMVICTSFSIARQFARKEKAEREAQLRSAHLENELLKKNINPHFLLNTLTSLIAWLRKDSKSAIKLIEALAEEFRMVLQISTFKQISIQQEIDLCRAHLKIMSYRKGADFRMETVGIVEEENVPPMIIHTLIENGLTHGYENKIKGTFTLQRRRNANGVQYILSHDGDYNRDDQRESTGVGMRYIKSRLEESYPHRWEVTSHWQPGGWETIIEIKET